MTREAAKLKSGFAHKKSLGQNFLTSAIVPTWMCDAATVVAGDTVLEIGPGTGRLTTELLARGATVIAIEADPRAIESLHTTFAKELTSGQLTLHYGDAREITPTTLGLSDQAYKVVANIPYFLSGILLRLMLESPTQPKNLVFLMQKELVARIARDPKESLLSLGVKAFGEPKYVTTVVRGHFFPVPKVDSAILAISNIHQDNFTDINRDDFFSILHLGLGKKRKQLLGNLAEQYDRAKLETIFTELQLKPTIRGEDVPLATWLTLTTKLME